MKRLIQNTKEFFLTLVARGKQAEQKKAGEKWDSIVEELKNRN